MGHEVFIALAAGIITFISPCVLPLIPAYIFYITGLKANEKIDAKAGYVVKILLFVLGFTIVFVTLGVLTQLLIMGMQQIRTYINIVFGVIVIIMGLHFMGVIKLFVLNSEKRMNFSNISAGFFSPVLIGMAFAAGWTPCVGPVLASILGLVATGDSFVKGIVLLVVFSLGMGIPLMLTAVFFNYVQPVVNFLKRHSDRIKIFSGIFLIFIGILILSNSLTKITIYAMKAASFLEESMPVSNYVFSAVLIVSGLLFLIPIAKKKKVLVVPSVFLALFVIIGILNLLNILPVLGYIITYLSYQGL